MQNIIEKYPAYRDSGFEWIGEIPKYWKSERLAPILNNVAERNRTDLPLLSITRERGVILRDLDNEEENHNFIPDDLSNYKVLRKGQFGMNKMKAWQGSYGISEQDGIVSPAYYIFQLRGDIDSRYFHLAIRSRLYISFFGSASDGVRIGQWDLARDRMKNIPFLIPPLSEQTTIAAFLDEKTVKIDQAISIKQKQIELLKERRQILIHKAVTRGLNPNIKLKDSGVEWIGEIPEGWEISALSYLAKIDTGSTPDRSRPNYWNGNIPWVKTGEVKYDLITETEEYITEYGLKNSATRLAPIGTILMAMYGQGVTRGRVAILGIPATYNQACCAILFNNRIESNFGYYFFIAAYPHVRDAGNETSQMNLSSGYISKLKIPIPPILDQKRIVVYIESATIKFSTAISLKEQEIEKLKEYKATLINSAVTGKIKVS
jgi:type I restriction enzyme, S subunit